MILQLYRNDGSLLNTLHVRDLDHAANVVARGSFISAAVYGKGGILVARFLKHGGWRDTFPVPHPWKGIFAGIVLGILLVALMLPWLIE